MEVTYTIPSTRVYPGSLSEKEARSLIGTFVDFNELKEFAVNRLYDERVLQEGKCNITRLLKDRYFEMTGRKLSDYYCTSIYSAASGIISSIKEAYKLRKTEHDTAQKKRKDKAASLEKRLRTLRDIKSGLIKASLAKKEGKAASLSVPAYYARFLPSSASRFALPDMYAFECMVDERIRRTKNAISGIRDRIHRKEEQFPDAPGRPTFGSRRGYRKKDTLHLSGDRLDAWHRDRDMRRKCRVLFSGRHTSSYGNFQCMYDPAAETMAIVLIDNTKVTFHGVGFPYRGFSLCRNFAGPPKERRSVGYTMEVRRDRKGHHYLLFKAVIKEEVRYVNFSLSDGVVAIDLNHDNISWSDIDRNGNYLDGGVIRFNLDGLSSGERKSILGQACSRVLEICFLRKKPLAMEELDLKKKLASLEYGGKKANRSVSGFAYRTMTDLLVSGAARWGTGIHMVDPAYTSVSGKTLYMRRFGVTAHEAAAYCIGRKAEGFREHMPPLFAEFLYKKNLFQGGRPAWNAVRNASKEIPPWYFHRKIAVFTTKKELLEQLPLPYQGKVKVTL